MMSDETLRFLINTQKRDGAVQIKEEQRQQLLEKILNKKGQGDGFEELLSEKKPEQFLSINVILLNFVLKPKAP